MCTCMGSSHKKIECANHVCKCYRSSLEKLVDENPKYKGKGGLTLKMRKRLACAARSAIKSRSQEPDVKKAIKLLQQDLLNGPMHCFGYHHKTDFCITAKSNLESESESQSQSSSQSQSQSSSQSQSQSSSQSQTQDDINSEFF